MFSLFFPASAICFSVTVLREGAHGYPFKTQIPEGDFPSSFEGDHGRVQYTLIVQIHRPWRFVKELRSELKFVSHIDANHPQRLLPVSSSRYKKLGCLCCASGPITIDCRLDRRGYIEGEMIRFIAEFENGSSRTLVPKVKLIQTQNFYISSRTSNKSVPKTLVKLEGTPVMPYRSGVWGDQMLQIPANTPFTISNCQILAVEYFLKVILCIPNSEDLSVVLPLDICSIPVCHPA